jgi:hypothetical protein
MKRFKKILLKMNMYIDKDYLLKSLDLFQVSIKLLSFKIIIQNT